MKRVAPKFDLSADFERAAAIDDDTASRAILALGMAITIARDDTPEGHFIRVYPDGHEELVKFDRVEAAKILGSGRRRAVHRGQP